MKKEVQLVMLSTNNSSCLFVDLEGNIEYDCELRSYGGVNHMHLYVIEQENIIDFVEGKWYYTKQLVRSNNKNSKIYQIEYYYEVVQYINGEFKTSGKYEDIIVFGIIATTNSTIDFPRIPITFINIFCKKGGREKNVLVEYENDYESSANEYVGGEIPFIPKLKISQNNEVSISLKPTVFSSEIMELLEKAHWFGWVARERLESPDKFPYDKFPHGLDYEESEDFCFQQFLDKFNIKQ